MKQVLRGLSFFWINLSVNYVSLQPIDDEVATSVWLDYLPSPS